MNTSHTTFAVLAGIISFIAFFPYIQSIFKGETKPSGASWWTWTIANSVVVVSSWYAGASWQVLLLPAWLCFSQLVIAILSLKRGDNTWDSLNKLCVTGSLFGVVLWFFTGQPLIALAISILADLLASIPNFRHVWKNPEQENLLGWTLGWLSAFFEIFTISAWSVAESGWPVYFFINMTVVLILVARPWLRKFLKMKNA